jgi:hypothetical protein
MSRTKSARRRSKIGAGRITVPKDHALVGRLMPDYLGLVMLVGAWRMSDGDDFAALWCLSRAIAESSVEQRVL